MEEKTSRIRSDSKIQKSITWSSAYVSRPGGKTRRMDSRIANERIYGDSFSHPNHGDEHAEAIRIRSKQPCEFCRLCRLVRSFYE
ncbi:hypothetical protein CDAR_470471 [Caerostris darwini]|uniref:Uncharacterized protein n=1 Tax=Caerostris darwini TaxID=1538125 RepID=A0AAV4VHL1_9ARAC|nr:hypothetical protein CDAR_470471 [Caerostris darwini]